MKSYLEWETTILPQVKGDALWKVEAYRLSMFVADLCWEDTTKILATDDARRRALADQLYRATCSVGANIAEGFGRSSGKEKAHFYEYALGSARESRDWYHKVRHLLPESVYPHRTEQLTQIIKLVVTAIPTTRTSTIREDTIAYSSDSDQNQ
jgi:four helix bundle protein